MAPIGAIVRPMRIVHELYGKEPQTTCSGRAYASTVDKQPTWRGMRVECLIVDSSQPEHDENGKEIKPFFSGDDIHIEGDLNSVRSALRDLLEQLDSLEELEKEEFEKNRLQYRQCPNCQMWANPKWDDHGDGKGNTCRFP